MNGEQKPAKKNNTILIVVIILLILVIGIVAWMMMGKEEATPETEETVVPVMPIEETTEEPAETEEETQDAQTGIEMDFENTSAIDPLDGKSSETYDLVMPKLEEVFPEGVKLTETSENYSTYMVNRTLTADDTTALRGEFEDDNFTIESLDEESMSVKKGQTTRLSINLYDIESNDRAEISIYHY